VFDLIGRSMSDWYLVYYDRPGSDRGYWEFLKKGMRHVEAWKLDGGLWLRFCPYLEAVEVEIAPTLEPPWIALPEATVQRVQTVWPHGHARSWFFFGPITCVEMVKALLGINSPWIRTPYQLFKFCKRFAA
jgi:hypothetical protein